MCQRVEIARAIVAMTVGCTLVSCVGPRGKTDKWIYETRIRGTDKVSAAELLSGLKSQGTPWYAWFPGVGYSWYTPAELDMDVQRIEHYYAAHGFFDAQVVGRKVIHRPSGKTVDVELVVEEGKSTRLVELQVVGLDALPRDRRKKLLRKLPLESNRRFDHDKYLESKELLKELLKEGGYAYAQTKGRVVVDSTKHEARVRLQAEPGPRVRMGSLKFEGAEGIPRDKLVNLVTWKKGDFYHPREISRTRARLFKPGVFSSVDIKLPEKPQPVVPVVIELAPSKLRELRLGGGAGLDQRWQQIHLSAQWTQRNFLGGLRQLQVGFTPKYVVIPTVFDIQRHGPAGKIDTRLTQPGLFGSMLTGFVGAEYELGLHEGYRYHGPKVQTGIDRMFWRDRVRAGISWNFQFLEFFDVIDTVDDIDNPLGPGVNTDEPYRLSWLEPFGMLDLRDDMLDPRAGFWASLRLEGGFPQIGSFFTYFKLTPEARGYIPLFTKRLVLALRAQFSMIQEKSGESTDTPVTRRIYMGGATSHRGFGYRRLAPQSVEQLPDGSTDEPRLIPEGGDRAVLFTGELRWQMTRLGGSWLNTIAFWDGGDVVRRDLTPLDLGNMHHALGGGFQYQTPIGSVGLSAAFRLNRTSSEQTNGRLVNPDPGQIFMLHLTIGGAF